jgi:hypothetical protein
MCSMKMSRLKFPFLLLAACAMGGIAGHCQTFAVTIKAPATSVSRNEPFAVSTEVRNVGTREEVIVVSPCLYPTEWSSDNPVLKLVDLACLQSASYSVKLKPNEAYRTSLFVRITSSESAKDRSVTFRLGNRVKLSGGESKPRSVTPPIWSKPLTIVVK